MALEFDPSEMTVKAATAELSGLSIEDLKEVLEAELAGKHRSSLMAEVTRQIDLQLESDESLSEPTVDVKEEDVEEDDGVSVVSISAYQWNHLRLEARRMWTRASDGSFYKEV